MLSDSGGWELTVSVSGVTCPRSYFPVLGGKQVFCWYFAVATLRAAHRELTVRAYIRDEVMSLRNWLYRLHPEAGFPPVSKMAAINNQHFPCCFVHIQQKELGYYLISVSL